MKNSTSLSLAAIKDKINTKCNTSISIQINTATNNTRGLDKAALSLGVKKRAFVEANGKVLTRANAEMNM